MIMARLTDSHFRVPIAKIVEHAHMDWPLEERRRDEWQRQERVCWYCSATYTAESNERADCTFHEHRTQPGQQLHITYEFPPPVERLNQPPEPARAPLRLTLASYERLNFADRLRTLETDALRWGRGWGRYYKVAVDHVGTPNG